MSAQSRKLPSTPGLTLKVLPLLTALSLLLGCTPPGALPPTATPETALPTCVRNAKSPTVNVTSSHGGRMDVVQSFPSVMLGNTRNLRIYLPPSYKTETTRQYPVLYMHDGQNLFDAASAAFGVEWQVDETVDAQYAAGTINEAIVVGIDNTGARMSEYTPTESDGQGGKGDVYARFVIGEVMPWVDTHYRTKCDAANTGLAGSSLGGLISLYMGWHYPQHFGKVAAMSTSLWWDDNALLKELQAYSGTRPAIKLWVDVGTGEGDDSDGNGLTYMVEDARALVSTALSKGFTYPNSLGFFEQVGVGHNEAAWASRFDQVSWYFFGRNTNVTVKGLNLIPYGDAVGATGLTRIPSQLQVGYVAYPLMTVPPTLAALTSTTPDVATIDTSGWITGKKEGTAILTATYKKVSTQAQLNVIPYLSDMVDMTLEVEVPGNTPSDATVYIAGSIEDVGGWDPSAVPLIQRDPHRWDITLSLPRGLQFEYKFTRGSWGTVEKDDKCSEIQNRVSTAAPTTESMTVLNWADRCQ